MLKEVDIEKAVTRRFPEPVVLVVSKNKGGSVHGWETNTKKRITVLRIE